ncbi:MAG: hypothetical protein JO086_15370 [Acidimicrobiia bacterium]|nr:hypothetical protein [Acidimicrobiia bacterium]
MSEGAGGRETTGDVECPTCHERVPSLPFCVRCGSHLLRAGGEPHSRRDHFAAAPSESVGSIRVISTLFPHLPRADMEGFRVALALGTAVVTALGLAGLFGVGVIAAAVLVPLLCALYMYDVDLYEGEPLPVWLFTALSGGVLGAAMGVLIRAIGPGISIGPGSGFGSRVLFYGIVVPLADGVLLLVGPLVLLRHRLFNDVLDGTTFGVTSGVCLVGAQTIVLAVPLLAGGLRPAGAASAWVYRLLELGVALPLIAAGAGGGTAAALWLRFRSPRRDERRLRRWAHPVVAGGLGAAALVGASLIQLYVHGLLALVCLLVLAAVALLLLRLLIHFGLLQEASEIPIGPDIVCANCGHPTPRHTFCGWCGVALRALPKGRVSGADRLDQRS